MAPGRHNRSTPARAGGARYARSLRVNQVLRQVVAEELERLADADERLRLVTVTSVDCSPDLRQAVVYLSSINDEAALALEERRLALQSCVGREVRMKRTPRLAFVADPAIVSGEAVESVLRRLVTERPGEDRGDESEGE
jgi:ribosome-binding factor A